MVRYFRPKSGYWHKGTYCTLIDRALKMRFDKRSGNFLKPTIFKSEDKYINISTFWIIFLGVRHICFLLKTLKYMLKFSIMYKIKTKIHRPDTYDLQTSFLSFYITLCIIILLHQWCLNKNEMQINLCDIISILIFNEFHLFGQWLFVA